MLPCRHRLGDFEILRLLGKGGMGEVYEAEQQNPRRPVALKVLAPWLAQDEDALGRFWREAEVPARLDHPNIVRIISCGRADDGTAYYVMQLVRGASLADLIRLAAVTPSLPAPSTVPEGDAAPASPGAVPPADLPPGAAEEYRADRFRFAARVGAATARALAFAHRQGHLHRDIKPPNLMVDHHGQVYVVDFGLTRALDADGGQSEHIRGTLWYMSPEQANGEPLDGRSDIFSLGVTLYELVTRGAGPYTADRSNRMAVLTQVRDGAALPLRVLAPDVPPLLEKIIGKAMHYRPNKRYPDADDLAADLEAFLAGAEPPETRPPFTRRRAWAGAAAGLLALGIVAASFALRGSPLNSAQGPTTVTPPDAEAQGPFPEALKVLPANTPLELLTKDFNPLWHRPLTGQGRHMPAEQYTALTALPGDKLMLALAVPRGRRFEFEVDLLPVRGARPGASQLGAFLGWQEVITPVSRRATYLNIEVEDAAPGDLGPGRLVAHSMVHSRPTDGRGWESGPIDVLGRRPLKPKQGACTLKVRLAENALTFWADGGEPAEVDLARLRLPSGMTSLVDPGGPLGVWAFNGTAGFRNAKLTVLPSPAGKD